MRRARLVETTGYAKRATALLLTVALAFCLFGPATPVSAVGASAETVLRRGLLASDGEIDLLDFDLSPAEAARLYAGLLQDDPALFHVAPRLSYAVENGQVRAVYPVYTLTGGELIAARTFYRETVADLLGEVDRALDGHARTEAEVALLVHDLLAARYDYDTRDGTVNTDAYTFFRDGVGVCQAYALAALALLRGAGLEADFVSSPAMDHAWVHVRVGGAWYHMDVTRDDPVAVHPDGTAVPAGMVTHTRVLRSDAGMRALGYHGYTCAGGHACTDGRYESPEVRTVLGALTAPLRPVSTGKDALVWVGTAADGTLLPLRLTDAGILLHAEGDFDGDGAVTAGDLLCLSGADVPAEWMNWMRKRVVEFYSATRMVISPEPSVTSEPSASTSRE